MIRKKPDARKVDRAGPPPVAYAYRHPFVLSLVSGLLLFAAFPPLGWSWLAWLAPIPWLLFVEPPDPTPRRFYWKIWLAAAVHWLIMLQGIRLAHPANYLGWFALSFYVAVYVPAFIGLTRYAVHRAAIPLFFSAAAVWTGLELVRSYMLTGFPLALLGHTQYQHPAVIQVADFAGAYGVSFLVMLVAASIVQAWRSRAQSSRRWLPLFVASTVLFAAFGYGWWRTASSTSSDRPLRVALLQGTRDKVFEFNPDAERKAFEQYRSLMKRARDGQNDLDLIVWPEGSFSELVPDYLVDGELEPPAESNLSRSEFEMRVELARRAFADKARSAATEANLVVRDSRVVAGQTHLIVGTTTIEFVSDETRQRNTALWIDPSGEVRDRYFKMHPVMFGEYIPFGSWWPGIYRLTPMSQGLTPGVSPVSFDIAGYRVSPSVCFESTVPHVMRKQVQELDSLGQSPDVLVNISDDGWFWGASILDLQLACGVFRAVELRRPFLVAANTGITASIDGSGRITDSLPRRKEGIVTADVSRDGRSSPYQKFGDLFAGACLALTLWWIVKPRFVKSRS